MFFFTHTQDPHRRWGQFALFFITIVIVGTGIYNIFSVDETAVQALVRMPDGTRSIVHISLQSGRLVRTDIDAGAVVIPQLHRLDSGSVVQLSATGVVEHVGGTDGPLSVLVASPVAPTVRTPLTVTRDGARLAWVSPTDNTLQVFSRTARDTYIPISITKTSGISSVGFSPDGTEVIFGAFSDEKTVVSVLNIETGAVRVLGTYDGFINIIRDL